MKKHLLSIILFFSIMPLPVQASSFGTDLVVWKGNIYDVQEEITLDDSQIGKKIGRVTTQIDELTGDYYGNASNVFPIGTKYFEILGISTSEAIAIEYGERWIQATYISPSSAHIMNVLIHPVTFFSIISIVLAILIFNAKQAQPKKRS